MTEVKKKINYLSLSGPKIETKALVSNPPPKKPLSEFLIGDKKIAIVNTSQGADSPKKIPKDQD